MWCIILKEAIKYARPLENKKYLSTKGAESPAGNWKVCFFKRSYTVLNERGVWPSITRRRDMFGAEIPINESFLSKYRHFLSGWSGSGIVRSALMEPHDCRNQAASWRCHKKGHCALDKSIFAILVWSAAHLLFSSHHFLRQWSVVPWIHHRYTIPSLPRSIFSTLLLANGF